MADGIHKLTDPAIRSAIRTLKFPIGSLGLDAGCGTGEHTIWLAEAVSPNGHVTGVDISPECLSRAEGLASGTGSAKGITFQYGDMKNLPFDDGVFDWAWSADTLWLEDPLPILKELTRVVKPRGIIALLFWSSQKLLPGYPLLEARLNATRAANFPYNQDMMPKMHILRALGWLQEAGLEDPVVHTFVADTQAPLNDMVRKALTESFQMFWRKAESELTAQDWDDFQRLCQPDSCDFILNLPDYYAFITYSLFYASVPRL